MSIKTLPRAQRRGVGVETVLHLQTLPLTVEFDIRSRESSGGNSTSLCVFGKRFKVKLLSYERSSAVPRSASAQTRVAAAKRESESCFCCTFRISIFACSFELTDPLVKELLIPAVNLC